jgi:hypothetical protein
MKISFNPAEKSARAANGGKSGATFSIYTLQGQLLYKASAASPEETIYLQEKGVYILRHKGKTYKFVF